MASRVKNSKWWLAHIKSWQKSEITQSQYCRVNNLNPKSFSTWKLKQYKQSDESSEADIPIFTSSSVPIPLIPVAISNQMESMPDSNEKVPQPSSSGFSGLTLIVKSDYQVSLALDFNPGTLRNLLSVLTE